MTDQLKRDAILSPHGTYRFRLTRDWRGPMFEPACTMAFVMLNPSTADALLDDATVRRCIGYAKRNDCNRIDVVNLFAYRATKPADLLAAHAAGIDIVGPDNVLHVSDAVDRAQRVVLAWGSNYSTCPPSPVMQWLAGCTRDLWCLGLTGTTDPRHPSRGPYYNLVRYHP